jgi:hypothetical protein
MAKFIIVYKGPATPPEQMAPEQTQKIMDAWRVWMEKLGSALLDIGAPMAHGRAVVDDGSSAEATELNGYSIIEAASIDEAVQLVSDHPFLSDHSGQFSVEVFELLPVPM